MAANSCLLSEEGKYRPEPARCPTRSPGLLWAAARQRMLHLDALLFRPVFSCPYLGISQLDWICRTWKLQVPDRRCSDLATPLLHAAWGIVNPDRWWNRQNSGKTRRPEMCREESIRGELCCDEAGW